MCLVTAVCYSNVTVEGRNSPEYRESVSEIFEFCKEVELRSYRNSKEFAVNDIMFKKLAEEQICNRYYINITDGEKELIEVKFFEEDFPYILLLNKTKYILGEMPQMYNIEIAKELEKNEYVATNLSNLHKMYIVTPENISFKSGDIIEKMNLLKLDNSDLKNEFKSHKEILEDLNIYNSRFYKYPIYKYISYDQNNCIRKATVEDLLEFYHNGYKFMVKTQTYKANCATCSNLENKIDKPGMNSDKSKRKIAEKKYKRRNFLTSKCTKCKGKKYIMIYEYRVLNINSKTRIK